jgi:hypothetical protein
MAEFQVPGPGLDQEARGKSLGEHIGGGCRTVLDVETVSHHRRPLERVARVQRERLGTQQNRVEHRLRQRQAACLGTTAIERERGGELLHIERDALRAVVEAVHDVVGELLARHGRRQQRGIRTVERAQGQLEQLALPAQLRAQAA